MIARIINHWNVDPLMARMLGGRTIRATYEKDVLSVAWEGERPFFVAGGIEAAQVGWSDVLTDLIEAVGRNAK